MFKIGDKVTVIKKVLVWGVERVCWVDSMDSTLNQTYTIQSFNEHEGSYVLNTNIAFGSGVFNARYPAESLELVIKIGEQMEFSFMKD